ncbi:IS4 family transposase [Endozoicomonas sp. SCSIO W0465]|uniref:IS4 family transposase n=1 Tax=Endozoicomonas sp. SCSIO W0465 TaxID=2918516 RepID=UPI0021130E12|nr:IS4 family transposase [Endozoicomonas sp. SCSIO W0465]
MTCFDRSELLSMAEQLGFTIRQRDIRPLDFILSLIDALAGDGNCDTQADLHRKVNELTGLNVSYRSWANQAKKDALPTLILWLWVQCLEIFSRKVMAFDEDSPFSEFEHILIQDGSSQAVYDALKEAFPGRFSTVSPAAVELHTTMDLLTNNLVRVQLTEDTRSERDCLPPLPTSMAYILMLMDAGYFELELFAAIDDREGSFICKAPQSINPTILSAVREDGKNLNRYKGQKLKDVLSGFPKDQCLDLDVEWPGFKAWPFRLVVRWNDKKQKWVFVVTNLNRVEFTLSDVLQAYRLRWQIELIFKEIKSYSGWHRFNTKSATLVFSLILMSFVVVTLKRYLAHAAQANLCESGSIEEISTHKVMKSGTHLFGNVISSLMNAGKSLVSCIKKLLDFWGNNAKREHPARDGCSGRTRLGFCAVGGA